jgi:Protein of unknown function (DUF3572)
MPERRREKAETESAQELAIVALGFIAADPQRLGRFLALTGIGPDSIREAAREPQFLAGVLEHIGSDERLLCDFANEQQLDPQSVTRARDALAGGRWERDMP